jgi:hypothetical protein
VNNEQKILQRKPCPNLRYYPSIYLEELRKIIKPSIGIASLEAKMLTPDLQK